MSVAAGQLLAYLKIGVLALALIAVIVGIVKYIEARGRGGNGGADKPEGD